MVSFIFNTVHELLDWTFSAHRLLRAENLSSCGVMTESDADLVVEYEDRHGACFPAEGEERSVSDSNTVNQDQDSFSILDGDSLLEAEGPQLDLPPLFVHVICSVNTKSRHGSMPVQTLPTCLGEARQNQPSNTSSSVGSLRLDPPSLATCSVQCLLWMSSSQARSFPVWKTRRRCSGWT